MKYTPAFTEALAVRTLVLDGGFGTMLRHYDLGDAVTAAPGHAGGCNDLLSVTRPDIVGDIHRRYLEAGADIVETNSFNSNALSLADYGLQDRAYEISLAAARVAREAVDACGRVAYVAGSVGPTSHTLSMSADVNSLGERDVTFEDIREAYRPQIKGLIDGGVDLLMVETVFDTLNAKAALAAIREISADVPVIVSATVADVAGRMLTGQTIEAFVASVMHARPVAVGLNCGFGAEAMLSHLQRLSRIVPVAVSVHPNAGLPNIDGGYDETPDEFAGIVKGFVAQGIANIVGGCCGTTPEHIRALRRAIDSLEEAPVRRPAAAEQVCRVSGLETLEIRPESNFINVGERANVAGSAKFARLIREGNYDEALSIAKAQVEVGAQIVDVCMDAPMIDAQAAMTRFLNLMASEPTVARVPVMIDSSDFVVIEAGLKCTQGKSVVNSISLKEGEDVLIEKARRIMRYGAAVVVMLFDERGQADTYDRKVEVARRSYDILTGIGFPAEDIIFDPNILSVATGMPEHDVYARDFIEATRWIKHNLPHAKVSGGVSNLSFAFRGNNAVRKAMHSVFLYHAISAGMDMAIVNPQMVQIYDEIEPELLSRVEDLILYRRDDAADRLVEYAQYIQGTDGSSQAGSLPTLAWRDQDVRARIRHAMLNGDTEFIAADTLEAYAEAGDAVAVINDVLMPAMAGVGQLFAEGKLFLPQVVKSARVMKLAVAAVEPYISSAAGDKVNARTAVIATVKGDVHDIGKNIVGVVLACNGWHVHDLGVMVDAGRILDEAVASGASAICLSGLITPSLDEMANVVKEAERRGLDIPIVVGGATTSDLHTAVKMAPHYRGAVVRAADAADNASIVAKLTAADSADYIAEVKASQAKLRTEHEKTSAKDSKAVHMYTAVAPCPCCTAHADVTEVSATISQVRDKINWSFFFAAWGLPGHYPEIFDHPVKGVEARNVYADAQAMLDEMEASGSIRLAGVLRKCKARIENEAVVLDCIGEHQPHGASVCLPLQRDADRTIAIDFAPGTEITLFALTSGLGLKELAEKYRKEGDEYSAMMAKFLCDRLVEAFADTVLPGGCRVAVGYPSVPDHKLKRVIFNLLDTERLTGMSLTETCMIVPGESICGFYF